MSAGTQEGRELERAKELEDALALGAKATEQLAGFKLDIWGRAVISLYRALTKAEQELAKATLERDEAVKRANPVRCSGCGSADTDQDIVASRTIRPDLLSCCPERQPLNIDAWRRRAEAAEARAAAMEAALRQIIKLYDPTSDDDFEAVQMVEIARATLAPQAEAGEPG